MGFETNAEIESYFDRLWPLLRSITGDGVRKTHDILAELVPLKRIEIPSGTEVFDWTVPREWRVREAYVVRPDGKKILDIRDNNLHLLNYSSPFKGKVTKEELDKHLFSLPDKPGAIPYLTSYYKERWGFCLSHNERTALPDGLYDVLIDTELFNGSMTLSEAVLPGETDKEVLISAYTCHPSLANNELSGPLLAAFLWRRLAALEQRNLTYRFVFLPETIGSVAYLSIRGRGLMEKMAAGYVVTCAAAKDGRIVYKRSRRGDSAADRAAEYVLKKRAPEAEILDFFPHDGSDERQYCSPGFNLPVGSVMRGMYRKYPEYHTSLDDKTVISFDALREMLDIYYDVCMVLDKNTAYMNKIMFCEARLGKRGLYKDVRSPFNDAALWLMSFSDGYNDLLDIAERSGMDFEVLSAAAEELAAGGVLEKTDKITKNGDKRP
jgi:aminopeptidase-like protein